MTRARAAAWYMQDVPTAMLARLRCAALALLAGGALQLGPHALAQATPNDAARALLAVSDADPLELARVVQRFGDAAIVRLLDDAQPLAARIQAVRATPWLSQPEDALAILARSVASRDAELAEAAAHALLEIARRLDAPALERRERSASTLVPVAAALQALQAQAWIRADLRALAASAAAQLEAIGSPPPPQAQD